MTSPRILFASGNISHGCLPLPRFTPADIGSFATDAGFDGVELTLSGQAVSAFYAASVGNEARLRIESLRQQPLPSILEMSEEFAPAKMIQKREQRSLRDVADFQTRIGRRFPTILRPHKTVDDNRNLLRETKVTAPLYIPSDELGHSLDVCSPQDMRQTLTEGGFRFVAYDTWQARHHSGAPAPISENWRETLAVFKPDVRMVRIALGHTGLLQKDTRETAKDELSGMLNGEARGDLSEMLDELQTVHPEFVVLDLKSEALAAVTGSHSKKKLRSAYSDIAGTIRHYFPARPL